MKNKLLAMAKIDLDSMFGKFYQAMLSSEDFSGFFEGPDQINSLIERQKKFLLDSIILSDEEIKARYIKLGEMHHEIKVPYIDFMAAAGILEQSLIRCVIASEDNNELLDFAFHFFKMIRAFTARGYLNKLLEEDMVDIDHYLSHVQRASEIDTLIATERVIWLKNVIFAIKIGNRAAAPALHMSPEVMDNINEATKHDALLSRFTADMAARMELNARNVFYFLEKGSYEEVLPLYKELMSIYKLTLMLTNVVTIATTNSQMQSLSKDSLTGLLTRHSFVSILSRELSIATAGRYQLAFIMVDIDHFKEVNDRFGHVVGDQVLSGVAQCVSAAIRSTDYAFRMGGEEFLLVLKGASLNIATAQAELIRKQVEQLVFDVNGEQRQVTASFGVAAFGVPFDMTYEQMLDAADKKLYGSKLGGRNRVSS